MLALSTRGKHVHSCPFKVGAKPGFASPVFGEFMSIPGASMADASLTEQLARRLQQPVDAASRRRAAMLMLDWLGCVLGALREPLAASLSQIVQMQAAGKVVAIGAGQHGILSFQCRVKTP